MPIFEYQATDQSGKNIRGTLFSADQDKARRDLQQRGLAVQKLSASGAGMPPPSNSATTATTSNPADIPAYTPYQGQFQSTAAPTPRSDFQKNVVAPLFGATSLPMLIQFFRQSATMLGSGISVAETMRAMSNRSGSAQLRTAANDFAHRVTVEGSNLHEHMAEYPELFNPLAIALTRAGEVGGFLPQAFSQIAEWLEREHDLRVMIKRSTFWNKLTLIFMLVMVPAVNLIIGQITKKMGPGAGITLWSPFLEPMFWVVTLTLGGGWLFFKRYLYRNESVQHRWDHLMVTIPYIGRTNRTFIVSRIGRTFGFLYRAGLSPEASLEVAAATSGNAYVADALMGALPPLRAGRGLTDSFASTGIFEPNVLDMLYTGEQSGNVDAMLEKMATYYEQEAETRAKAQAQMLAMAIMVGTGIMVGITVVSFYSSYFSGMFGAGADLAE